MKHIIFSLLIGSFVQTAQAGQDSVGVFYRPEKVVILINEAQGAPRLQGLMEALGAQDTLVYQSADESLRIQCGRQPNAATCTFRVLQGVSSTIAPRRAEAFIPVSDLPVFAPYEMTFESSMQDRFTLKVTYEGVWFAGSKKN